MHRERHSKPRAVWVDLGRVRKERAVTDMEIVGTVNPRRDPRRVLGVLRPVTEPLGVRRLEATRDHRPIQRHRPLAVEGK